MSSVHTHKQDDSLGIFSLKAPIDSEKSSFVIRSYTTMASFINQFKTGLITTTNVFRLVDAAVVLIMCWLLTIPPWG